MADATEADLIAFVLREATVQNDPDPVIAGVGERLVAAGLPIWRFSVVGRTIDPAVRGVSLIWTAGGGIARLHTGHGEDEAAFQRSPVFTLIREERTFGRWSLDDASALATYPLLADLAAAGATDYAMFLVPFAPGTVLSGAGVAITTKAPGGFSDGDIATMQRILPAIGLALFRMMLWHSGRTVLDTYLGPMTGGRVLAGEIRRGDGQRISAAIMLVDLAGFTSLVDQEDGLEVVAWLDEHLEALGEPVLAEQGEILKFLGDGFLAVFPAEDGASLPCASCDRALRAATAALAANEAVNARRRAACLPVLRADLVLHYGEVVYGNVGTRRRLDFTTIGRAVNEASRFEALCDTLERSPIISDSFAARCHRAFVPLGEHRLRGLATPRILWGLNEDQG